MSKYKYNLSFLDMDEGMIKGIKYILGDVWIMGMHRGYGLQVSPGYGSEPYILSHVHISHIIPKDCHRNGMRLLEARSTKAH